MTFYKIDLNHGAFSPQGEFKSLVTASAQLKTFKQGFPNARIIRVTEEILLDSFVVKTLEQVERINERNDLREPKIFASL